MCPLRKCSGNNISIFLPIPTGSFFTTYGATGIKVWIFKGEIMEHDPSARDRRLSELKDSSPRSQKSVNVPQERVN